MRLPFGPLGVCLALVALGHLGPGSTSWVANAAEPEYISLIQLIANPEAHHGKLIQAIGFCWLEYEGNGLYVHQSDFEHNVLKNALWLDLGWPEPAEYRRLSGQYVLVEAVFDAEQKGHFGLYSGELKEVRRMMRWPPRGADKDAHSGQTP